jgi:hypothetical protein
VSGQRSSIGKGRPDGTQIAWAGRIPSPSGRHLNCRRARVVGIDPKTLRKHYRDELDTGQIKATAKVAEFLFRKATTEGSQAVTAAIFWLKTRGGWRETPQDHRVGIVDVRQLSDAELESMIAGHLAALGKTSPADPLLVED